MRKLIIVFFSFALLFAYTDTVIGQNWYNTNWLYRKTITIDQTKVPNTSQTNFPVLVNLSADASLNAHARSDGFDILFTSSNGTTKINYEREKYSSGTLVAWVQVPILSYIANTVIYMYYGNSGASDQQAATSVWDANYKGVYHLKEATGSNPADATSNGHNGTQSGSPTQAAGEIDGSLTFNGSNYVDMGNVSDFNFGTGAFTISCWLKGGANSQFILGKDDFNGNNSGTLLYEKSNTPYGTAYWPGSSYGNIYIGVFDASWHYCVITRTGTGVGETTTYYDGNLVTTSTEPRTLSNSTPFRIGKDNATSYAFTGSIDEVHLSNITRSADWIKTEYNNQSSPSTFYSVAAEEILTYIWNQTGTASWATTTNWTPTRTIPATTDILQFNGGGSVTATSVPTQTIAQLLLSNNSIVNLTTASIGNTLTVNDALTTTSGDVLNLGSGLLLGGTLTTLSNSGKIQTSVLTTTSSVPIPVSKTWGGTVEYNGSGAQTLVSGTYNNLTINQSSGDASLGGITIVNGTLTLTSGSIALNGNTLSYGASGILKYDGSASQITSYEWPAVNGPKDLTVDGTDVRLDLNRTLTGGLTINSGKKFTLNAGKQLTVIGTLTNIAGTSGLVIKSDATGTGSLIHSTADVSATVEHYIPEWNDANHGWHIITSPVSSQTINPNFTDPTPANYDFFKWDETVSDLPWINYKSGGFTTFTVGQGYLCAYNATATKNFTGTLNNASTSTLNLTRTEATNYSGWNLLGNPFPSAIQWNKTTASWNLTNVSGTAKVWNETNASYSDIAQNGIIPAMQGFMVEVPSGTSGSLVIPSVDKVHDAQAWYKNTETNRLMLVAHDPTGQTVQESIIRFDDNATEGFDMEYDAHFFAGYAPQFYSISGDEHLSTNTLPTTMKENTISIGFVKNDNTSFSIEAKGLETFTAGTEIWLQDLKTGTQQKLNDNPVYSFTSVGGDETNRFKLKFGWAFSVNESSISTFSIYTGNSIIYVNNNGKQSVKGTINVYSVTGQLIASNKLTGDSLQKIDFNGKPGCYVVKITAEQGVYSQKVIIK
ncbi:MAG: DUF2341 domain-containing protein [Bacteroidales bacterium]|jgi:hypothetical protein|nr:DUF2341 domain-containing protein [Bacteroidales bacterium]